MRWYIKPFVVMHLPLCEVRWGTLFLMPLVHVSLRDWTSELCTKVLALARIWYPFGISWSSQSCAAYPDIAKLLCITASKIVCPTSWHDYFTDRNWKRNSKPFSSKSTQCGSRSKFKTSNPDSFYMNCYGTTDSFWPTTQPHYIYFSFITLIKSSQ